MSQSEPTHSSGDQTSEAHATTAEVGKGESPQESMTSNNYSNDQSHGKPGPGKDEDDGKPHGSETISTTMSIMAALFYGSMSVSLSLVNKVSLGAGANTGSKEDRSHRVRILSLFFCRYYY